MTEMGSGPGTDICGSCGGAKEPTRRNSMRCRACDNGDKNRRTRTYRLPLTVDETLWLALTERAAKAGVSVYVMGRQVLREAVLAPVSDESDTAPAQRDRRSLTDEQLLRARKWIDDTERTLPDSIKTRTALREWLASEGFVL